LPELVHSEVGALLNMEQESEWIQILRSQKLPWDPQRCRQWALDQFHYLKMTQNYESLYQRILKGEELHSSHPIGEFL
jgi:hypothetical protein